MTILIHGLQSFCSIVVLLTVHSLLVLDEGVHLVHLVHLVAGVFQNLFPASVQLGLLHRVPTKASSRQIVPQIDNILIQGMQSVHNLFG